MNNREYYKTLYEHLQAQCNLIEANIAQAQAQAVVASDMVDPVSSAPIRTTAGTTPPGGIPIPPGLPPAPGILPNWPMPPIGGPGWNQWLGEWYRLNAPTPPRRGETPAQYQERRRANQAIHKQFGRWRDLYWRLSQERPITAGVQESTNLIEKRFDISKFNKSKKKGKKSTKDYDEDGEVESSEDEYFGSKDKAIKKAIDKKKKKTLKEGTVISDGQISYGGFPRILNEEDQEPRRSRGGIVYPSEEYAALHQASQEAGAAAAAANDAALKYHQEAAKDWRGVFSRQTPASRNNAQHMAELSKRMDRDPNMQQLRADLASAQKASDQAYRTLIQHPHHAEFMKKAQSQSDSVYGTRGNLGS